MGQLNYPLQSPWQSSLQPGFCYLFTPANGTTGTGTGFGMTWTPSGTIDHPAPDNTNPAINSQQKRTRYSDVVTTQNQTLGLRFANAEDATMWRGDAAGLGGFYFMSRFIIGAWPANTVRLFVGLTSSTTSLVTSDTPGAGSFIGLWHDTTDGATTLSILTRDGTTRNKSSAISGVPTLQAGLILDFHLFAKPNDTVIHWKLDYTSNGTTIASGSTSTNIPLSATFLGPQVAMSNGTANVTANDTRLSICRIYGASHY